MVHLLFLPFWPQISAWLLGYEQVSEQLSHGWVLLRWRCCLGLWIYCLSLCGGGCLCDACAVDKTCHSFQWFHNCDNIFSQSQVVFSHNTFNIFLLSVICHRRIHCSLLLKISFDRNMAWIPSSWCILDEFVNRKLQQLLLCLQHMGCCCASVKGDHSLVIKEAAGASNNWLSIWALGFLVFFWKNFFGQSRNHSVVEMGSWRNCVTGLNDVKHVCKACFQLQSRVS